MNAPRSDSGYTAERYFALVATGELRPDDRVELLDGVIVAEPPQEPEHASATRRTEEALRRGVRDRAVVSVQMPLRLGSMSVPEPDVALLPGRLADYDHAHATTALLVVEVASTSLPQDRLSKARIYAAAGIPEYWIVNLREDCVEVLRAPDAEAHQYADRRIARRGDTLTLVAFPDAVVTAAEILPGS